MIYLEKRELTRVLHRFLSRYLAVSRHEFLGRYNLNVLITVTEFVVGTQPSGKVVGSPAPLFFPSSV